MLYGMNLSECETLARRDVFGRVSAEGETFDDWSSHIALLSRNAGLANILNALGQLRTCFIETWQDRASTASLLPQLRSAIASRDAVILRELARRAALHDWDALYPHEDAGRVTDWLASVAAGAAPAWDQAEVALLTERIKR